MSIVLSANPWKFGDFQWVALIWESEEDACECQVVEPVPMIPKCMISHSCCIPISCLQSIPRLGVIIWSQIKWQYVGFYHHCLHILPRQSQVMKILTFKSMNLHKELGLAHDKIHANICWMPGNELWIIQKIPKLFVRFFIGPRRPML